MRSLSAVPTCPSPSVLTWPNLTMERTRAQGFGKGPRPARGSAPVAGWVPAWAVHALLLWVADERAACVPTWVVLTCGCRDGTEVDVCKRGRTGAALTRIPCEELKWVGSPDLVAAVAQSGAARVEPWCKHDDHWCGWCCWDCR